MPFENYMAIVEVPGRALHELCDKMAREKGWPVAGMRFVIKDGKAVNINIGDVPLDETRLYMIAVNDYNARGGDNCDMLMPLKKKYTNVLIRDIMIEEVRNLQQSGKPLHPTLDKRITYE